MLMNWAKHLAHTDDPFSLPEGPIDKALLGRMLQIARSDMTIAPALGDGTAMAAEFR